MGVYNNAGSCRCTVLYIILMHYSKCFPSSVFNRLGPTKLNRWGTLRALNSSPLSLAWETTVSAIKPLLLLADRHSPLCCGHKLYTLLCLRHSFPKAVRTSVGVSADGCLPTPWKRVSFNKTVQSCKAVWETKYSSPKSYRSLPQFTTSMLIIFGCLGAAQHALNIYILSFY